MRSAERTLSPWGRVALGAGVLWLLAAQALLWRHTVDDTYIVLRYADNVAGGLGYVFNPGERVEGSSQILWVVLLAAARWLGAEPLLTAKLLGVLGAIGCVLVQIPLARRLAAGRPSVVGSWLMALSPITALWSIAGMETIFYAFLLSVAMLAAATDVVQERPRWWTGALYATVGLLRAEGWMFIAPYAVILLWRAGRGRLRWADAISPLAVYAMGFVATEAWRLWAFGALVPNLFFAKVYTQTPMFDGRWTYLREWMAAGGWLPVGLALLPLAALESTDLAVAGLLYATVGLQAAFIVAVRGDWMSGFRFIVPALPALYVLAGRGARLLRIRGESMVPRVAPALSVLFLASTLAWAARSRDRLAHEVLYYTAALSGAHETLGRQLRASVSPGTVIALDDCGVLPYASGLPAVDLLGLTDAFIARHAPSENARYVLDERRPDLIVIAERDAVGPRGDRVRGIRFPVDFAIVQSPAFAEGYESIGLWPFTGFYDLHLYARRGFAGIDRLRQDVTGPRS